MYDYLVWKQKIHILSQKYDIPFDQESRNEWLDTVDPTWSDENKKLAVCYINSLIN